jgi:hypothetical protein
MSDRRREPVLTDFLAAMRSSIRSRSTSHNLSDENSSLSICSASADSSAFRISGRHTSDRLLDCRDRSLDRDVRLRLCSHRADPISYPFLMNRFLSRSSRYPKFLQAPVQDTEIFHNTNRLGAGQPSIVCRMRAGLHRQ